jgi:transcription elongation factor GreA-like protein
MEPIDNDTIRKYYQKEYIRGRFIDIATDLVTHKKDLKSYEDFIRAFFRLDLTFIENYLILSYKETFVWRLYILFLKSDVYEQYRNFWKIQRW